MSIGAPCGACKFLRRKCVKECIFAPYFGSEQGASRFAAVHKIFGASNVSKLLNLIPIPKQYDAILTITYEAQARISDPVYGCVSQIITLQQQVANLQTELAMIQSQIASRKQLANMGYSNTRLDPSNYLFEASLDPSASTSLPFNTNIVHGGNSYHVKKERNPSSVDFLDIVGSTNIDPHGSSPHQQISYISYQPLHQPQTIQHNHDNNEDVEYNKLQPFHHHPLLYRK